MQSNLCSMPQKPFSYSQVTTGINEPNIKQMPSFIALYEYRGSCHVFAVVYLHKVWMQPKHSESHLSVTFLLVPGLSPPLFRFILSLHVALHFFLFITSDVSSGQGFLTLVCDQPEFNLLLWLLMVWYGCKLIWIWMIRIWISTYGMCLLVADYIRDRGMYLWTCLAILTKLIYLCVLPQMHKSI